MTGKPFSQACENNKQPILDGLLALTGTPGELLEIGSGTGQHAAFLPAHLPHLTWQPSDLPDNLPGIGQWLADSPSLNVRRPIVLDVNGRWPDQHYHYLFTANTFHIMDRASVERCITCGADHLQSGGLFIVYGPMKRQGRYTSDSNAAFDEWLQERDPRSGIRDLEWIHELMQARGLSPVAEQDMPANNLLLSWRK